MLKQRNIQHRRKNSQINLFYPNHNQPSLQGKNQKNIISKEKHKNNTLQKQFQINKQKNNKSTQQKQNKNKIKLSIDSHHQKHSSHTQDQAKRILKLLQNSQKRVKNKQVVIQSINNQNDQNYDSSNQNTKYLYSTSNTHDSNLYDPFFQFGRRSRNSIEKDYQNHCNTLNHNTSNNYYNYLNMEEITEVPDTMSNQRRYDTTNFYPFITSQKNSLINFSNKLSNCQSNSKDQNSKQVSQQEQKTCLNTVEQFKTMKQNQKVKNQILQKQKNNELNKRNLKQRRQKCPKNIVIQTVQNHNKLDMTLLMPQNKTKRSPHVKSNQFKKSKSKSKQLSKKLSKQKSALNFFLGSNSKQMSYSTLNKKKSLSLKNQNKQHLLKLSNLGDGSKKRPKSEKAFQSGNMKSKLKNQNLTKSNINLLSLGQKMMMIQESQSKLQNQYKVLWECVGELWENSRITRYISQKNKVDIVKLKDNQKSQDQKLIKLKSQIISSISSARY